MADDVDKKYVPVGIIHKAEGIVPASEYFNDPNKAGLVYHYGDGEHYWMQTEDQWQEFIDG